jgi:hypothetical protein
MFLCASETINKFSIVTCNFSYTPPTFVPPVHNGFAYKIISSIVLAGHPHLERRQPRGSQEVVGMKPRRCTRTTHPTLLVLLCRGGLPSLESMPVARMVCLPFFCGRAEDLDLKHASRLLLNLRRRCLPNFESLVLSLTTGRWRGTMANSCSRGGRMCNPLRLSCQVSKCHD